jgi:hypothetical protein
MPPTLVKAGEIALHGLRVMLKLCDVMLLGSRMAAWLYRGNVMNLSPVAVMEPGTASAPPVASLALFSFSSFSAYYKFSVPETTKLPAMGGLSSLSVLL